MLEIPYGLYTRYIKKGDIIIPENYINDIRFYFITHYGCFITPKKKACSEDFVYHRFHNIDIRETLIDVASECLEDIHLQLKIDVESIQNYPDYIEYLNKIHPKIIHEIEVAINPRNKVQMKKFIILIWVEYLLYHHSLLLEMNFILNKCKEHIIKFTHSSRFSYFSLLKKYGINVPTSNSPEELSSVIKEINVILKNIDIKTEDYIPFANSLSTCFSFEWLYSNCNKNEFPTKTVKDLINYSNPDILKYCVPYPEYMIRKKLILLLLLKIE